MTTTSKDWQSHQRAAACPRLNAQSISTAVIRGVVLIVVVLGMPACWW